VGEAGNLLFYLFIYFVHVFRGLGVSNTLETSHLRKRSRQGNIVMDDGKCIPHKQRDNGQHAPCVIQSHIKSPELLLNQQYML
jgi:hypothetical protein